MEKIYPNDISKHNTANDQVESHQVTHFTESPILYLCSVIFQLQTVT